MVIADDAGGDATTADDIIGFLNDYYRQDIGDLVQKYPTERTTLTVAYDDLARAFPRMAERYLHAPDEVEEELTNALRLFDLPVDISLDEATVRVTGLPAEHIHDVGVPKVSQLRGKLQGIRGQVAKRTQKQQVLEEAEYECQRCGSVTTIPQTDDKRIEPNQCHGCERDGPFVLKMDHSTFADYQLLRLQTPPEADLSDTYDVICRNDLVGQARPGDRVVANCLTEMREESAESLIYEPIGHAHSLDHLEATFDDIDPQEYMDDIKAIATSPNPIEYLIDSIVPSHQGDEHIKRAIALQLFGGVDKELPDGSRKRGTIHCLMIGDPGCGKSALLRYAANLSPRSVKASGKTSTAAGLTAAATRDDFGGGQWTLEAGALVEANGGLCAIDELDDMDPDDRAGLLQAMAEQEISVSKAGINATLPANTTVLAAANPKHGRFTEHETDAEQFGLSPVLLSRFDLIFTMRDTPDEERDKEIARTITDGARVGQRAARGESVEGERIAPHLSPELLRAYVAHARTITPVLTDDAQALIEEKYAEIRQANDDDGPIPVTARMNEALIRLAEASARIRLSEEIEEVDARRAIDVHRSSLEAVGFDPETGEMDVDVVESGTSKTQRDRNRDIETIIRGLEDETEQGAPLASIIAVATDKGHSERKVEHTIRKLREQGSVYTPQSDDHYRVVK